MKIELIDTGYFYADGGAMFGAIPKTAWSRRYPANESNACVLAIRSLLVTTDNGDIILVDNGVGNKHLKTWSYYHFFDQTDLNTTLRDRGISPEQITDVILTHLHFDHCGYTTQWEENTQTHRLTYPNARHWVSQAQWDNFKHPHPLEKDSYFRENMEAVYEKDLLYLLSSPIELYPGIELRLYDGHTPGQIVPYISLPERTYVFAGDVIPLAACLSPEWISAYDLYPAISFHEKHRMLEEAVREKQAIIFCHDAYTPCSTVKQVKTYYKKEENILLS
ncbi:MBL fold metallo-hydrolase [Parabacteroides sp. 52]|uniref:MBL fold metallo-hydrolase n=1 Tax=unclassified Parabacteroides TaxID=2649774 RepID=UPI0013D64B2C|nr:MBL fold metallo-hydrolase [Parabacteroides sp. PM5-20]MDH6535648.1 glyoxylase-like metal-dependent hydrolase (beta-lactamase superfamily II) [Parabacteroides sp. PM5-20]NDV56287.1 MBL fold metallo-hydrolase [Parabacteroides sp. 52]